MKKKHLILLGALSLAGVAHADDSTLNAAIGGGIGAAVGNEVGGREGAIVGGALGAAIGTSGDGNHERRRVESQQKYEHRSGGSKHCPPGLAKQGRC